MIRAFVVCALLCLAGISRAEHNPLDYNMDLPIVFTRDDNWHSRSNQTETLRVNIDLSLDSGSNWHKRIAHGYTAKWGTNIVNWSMRVTPDFWTDHARVGVRTLWSSTTNRIILYQGDMSDGDFSIKGVRFISPTNNETVLQPGYKTIRWHEAGFDSVTIGMSTNSGASWTQLYVVPSPNPTNSYSLPIIGLPTGRVDFVVWANTDLYHTVRVNIRNQ